jgi:cob(I)alamin adenosyltransferase
MSAVKLYTRMGDAGETAYFDGTRVRKDDPRLDTYGEVDELSAWLGFVRALGLDPVLDADVARVQRDLFALGAQLADPREKLAAHVTKAVISDADVERLEALIDRSDAEVPPVRRFILAGGVPAGAALHVARTVCRRVERRMVCARAARGSRSPAVCEPPFGLALRPRARRESPRRRTRS